MVSNFNLNNYNQLTDNCSYKLCLDEAKEEKDSERVEPRDIERSYEITSKASPSLPSDDLLDEVV